MGEGGHRKEGVLINRGVGGAVGSGHRLSEKAGSKMQRGLQQGQRERRLSFGSWSQKGCAGRFNRHWPHCCHLICSSCYCWIRRST